MARDLPICAGKWVQLAPDNPEGNTNRKARKRSTAPIDLSSGGASSISQFPPSPRPRLPPSLLRPTHLFNSPPLPKNSPVNLIQARNLLAPDLSHPNPQASPHDRLSLRRRREVDSHCGGGASPPSGAARGSGGSAVAFGSVRSRPAVPEQCRRPAGLLEARGGIWGVRGRERSSVGGELVVGVWR